MQKYEAIERGILNNDIKSLREAIGSICYTDRSFSTNEFDEVLNYVLSKKINIKDTTLVGKLVSEGKDNFVEKDFTRAVLKLKNNFCDERINDVKMIGRMLYKDSININSEEYVKNSTTSPKEKDYDQEEEKSLINIALPVAIVVSVAVIATIIYMTKK